MHSRFGPRKCVAVLFVLLLSSCLRATAQLPEPAPSPALPPQTSPSAPPTRPAIQILRFNEDWSVLQYPALRTDRLDAIKYIPLSRSQPLKYASIGGEFRGTFEQVKNDNFTQTPFSVYRFGMERFQLFADLHLDPRLRFFIQLESGLEQNRAGGPRPIDEKKLDFLNAFVDLRPIPSDHGPLLRVGRQEFNFGSGRLIAVREGPNVRQGFYGFDVRQQLGRWTIDGVAARPAKDNPGYFDNIPLSSTGFWTIYSSRAGKGSSGTGYDFYYIGLDRKSATFQSGTARELRHTFGGRVVRPAPAEGETSIIPHFDIESVVQTGTFGSRDILAWTVSGEFGYILQSSTMKPHIGIRADVSSGDGGIPSKPLGTFNPIFPIGGYFGVISDTGPGPVNFRSLRPDLQLTVHRGVTIDSSWVFYWRQSLRDGVYNVPGSLLVPTPDTTARFVGHRPGTQIRWQITPHAYVQGDYGVFFAGDFMKAAGRPHNLNYASAWVGYKF